MNPSTMSSPGIDDLWIVVEDEEPELDGMTLVADRESGDIVSLSARSCRDEQKSGSMPSLEKYPHLKVVDLHNYRNLRDLHESVCSLPDLQKLALTRCDFLTRIPASIGNLENLVEVSITVAVTFRKQTSRLTSVHFLIYFVFRFLSFSQHSLTYLILLGCRGFLKKFLDVEGKSRLYNSLYLETILKRKA